MLLFFFVIKMNYDCKMREFRQFGLFLQIKTFIMPIFNPKQSLNSFLYRKNTGYQTSKVGTILSLLWM